MVRFIFTLLASGYTLKQITQSIISRMRTAPRLVAVGAISLLLLDYAYKGGVCLHLCEFPPSEIMS